MVTDDQFYALMNRVAILEAISSAPTVKLTDLPTGTPVSDDILLYVDMANNTTKKALYQSTVNPLTQKIVNPPLTNASKDDGIGYTYQIGDYCITQSGVMTYLAIGKWSFISLSAGIFSGVEWDTSTNAKTINYKCTGALGVQILWGDSNSGTTLHDGALHSLTHTYADTAIYIALWDTLLPNLTYLDINTQQVTRMDVKELTGLDYLDLSVNNITDVQCINKILVDLDTNAVATGTVNLSGGTNAAPTDGGTYNGLTAKANLITKGWTVTTN